MNKSRTAFTLAELLTVVAILIVLAAVLFPVFRSSLGGAKKTVCASNFRQAYLATYLYVEDYNDTFMPINYVNDGISTSKNDRTWVQMMLPYAKGYGIFRCPSDFSVRPQQEATFDEDLVPGDIYSRYYRDSMRTNLGYNYLYLSPVSLENDKWISHPRQLSELDSSAQTLLFVDTVWDLDTSGSPVGGGNWLVVPPCRYAKSANQTNVIDTFSVNNRKVLTRSEGWVVDEENSGLRYGGAWPWHRNLITVVQVGGSTRAITVKELADGCSVQEAWTGFIQKPSEYIWNSHN